MPDEMVLGGGAFGRCLGQKDGTLMNTVDFFFVCFFLGLMFLWRDPTQLPDPFYNMRTQWKGAEKVLAMNPEEDFHWTMAAIWSTDQEVPRSYRIFSCIGPFP